MSERPDISKCLAPLLKVVTCAEIYSIEVSTIVFRDIMLFRQEIRELLQVIRSRNFSLSVRIIEVAK